MTPLVQDLSPLLAALLVVTVAWFVRTWAGARSRRRLWELHEAAEFLDTHARALERFLDDPAAPTVLKRLLLSCSDTATDREAVGKLIAWAASRPLDQPADMEQVGAASDALTRVAAHRPELAEDFAIAVMTAVAGGSLRWPESAALVDSAFMRLATIPKHDVAIAVTAASLRAGAPFSLRQAAPAAA